MTDAFQIVPAGDAALIVQFAERIDPTINARAIVMADALRASPLPGLRDVVPTFRSVAIYFDPLLTERDRLLERLRALASVEPQPVREPEAPIRIPVRYGGEFGPDLADVARFASASESDVVALHTSATYRVFMLGFLPGFAYLGTVDARIAAPRRATPRTNVPAGSVAIAGLQTGVYPSDTPGGWQIVGRTPVQVFDLARSEPCLLKAGDTVQFFSMDPQ
jgi:KipI family sensor histidine kinase inhibitor